MISCDTSQEKYFMILKGEWQCIKFYHNKKDLSQNNYVINFYNSSNFWILNFNQDKNDFITSKYNIFKDTIILKMDIECEDKSLNGNYNVYIDTIGQDAETYHIRLTLDSEKNYIQAIRHKLKYYSPPADRIPMRGN